MWILRAADCERVRPVAVADELFELPAHEGNRMHSPYRCDRPVERELAVGGATGNGQPSYTPECLLSWSRMTPLVREE